MLGISSHPLLFTHLVLLGCSRWCFLPGRCPLVVGEAGRKPLGQLRRTLGMDGGLWHATSDGTLPGGMAALLAKGWPPRCSGHQAQPCDFSRQEGMDDENNWLGAGMEVQRNLSVFASKV